MVVHPTAETLDLSLLTLFAGWALSAEVQRRLAADGFPDLRFNDGVLIQHVIDEPISISALASRMGVTQQAASKAVAELERRGLLRRTPSRTDARVSLIALSDHGHAAVHATRTHRAALDAELTTEFGETPIAHTRAVLTALLTRLDTTDAIRNRRIRPPI